MEPREQMFYFTKPCAIQDFLISRPTFRSKRSLLALGKNATSWSDIHGFQLEKVLLSFD